MANGSAEDKAYLRPQGQLWPDYVHSFFDCECVLNIIIFYYFHIIYLIQRDLYTLFSLKDDPFYRLQQFRTYEKNENGDVFAKYMLFEIKIVKFITTFVLLFQPQTCCSRRCS